jgi:hypothetical protein
MNLQMEMAALVLKDFQAFVVTVVMAIANPGRIYVTAK